MKQIISSSKVPLKGYTVQSFNSSSKKVKGGKGKKTISKATMPVSFKKGTNNPIKYKNMNGMDILKKAFKK